MNELVGYSVNQLQIELHYNLTSGFKLDHLLYSFEYCRTLFNSVIIICTRFMRQKRPGLWQET